MSEREIELKTLKLAGSGLEVSAIL